MSWKEICNSYPDEYVLLCDVRYEDAGSLRIKSATVVAHGKSTRDLQTSGSLLICKYTGVPRSPLLLCLDPMVA